ncbi:MAG: NAD(P)/FAD-dependent oxidoreductase [Gemmatimonadales bacterium]
MGESAAPRSVDVLIAGAGPAGSRLAARLAGAGWDVLLVDRARFPREKACSEYMSPATVELLHRAGVLEAVDRAGANPLDGTTVVAPRGARLTGIFARTGHPAFRGTGLAFPRRDLDHLLLDAARRAGARVVEGTAVEELVEKNGCIVGAILRCPDGTRREVRARLTAGTDGLRSLVARRMGRTVRFTPDRLAFVAHVNGVRDLRNTTEMHVGASGYAGLNPLGNDLANVALVVPRRRAPDASGRVRDFFIETLATFPGVRGRVPAGGITREVMVTGPFNSWSRRVTADGALLAGDAADFFDPFTGEGIYAALKGAELAAGVLEEALTRPGTITARALSEYPRLRRRAFSGKWAVERLIGYAMYLPALFNRAVDRMGRRGRMAHTLIGVTGDFVPAREVLNPVFLSRMIW